MCVVLPLCCCLVTALLRSNVLGAVSAAVNGFTITLPAGVQSTGVVQSVGGTPAGVWSEFDMEAANYMCGTVDSAAACSSNVKWCRALTIHVCICVLCCAALQRPVRWLAASSPVAC